jgi:hypothetical protein
VSFLPRGNITFNEEQDYIFLGDISIPLPPVLYRPNDGDSTWRHATAKKLGKFYLKMGLERPTNRSLGMSHYKIPGSIYYVKPILTYGYTPNMRDAPIALSHEIVMYDGLFDSWSVPLQTEFILNIEDVDTEVLLFNLDLFSGPVHFKWSEFGSIFDAYID